MGLFSQFVFGSLPLEFPHQRAGRVAEQLFDRGRVELVDAFELLGMDAPGDEQAIDAGRTCDLRDVLERRRSPSVTTEKSAHRENIHA